MCRRINPLPRRTQHRILDHPLPALILLPLWCMGVAAGIDAAASALSDPAAALVSGLGTAVGGLLCLGIHKAWFAPAFDGDLKMRGLGRGFLMLLPVLACCIVNLWETGHGSFAAGGVLRALCLGLGPGIMEEAAFRALPCSNLMRVWREEEKLPAVVLLTSALFGLVHVANAFTGAGAVAATVQTVYAFGAGVIFAAVYLRTGSLLPSILVHTLVDLTAFLNGDAPEELPPLAAVTLGFAFAVLGFYYIRPAKRGEILRLWEKKME